VYGAGGKEHAPNTKAAYRFIREVSSGTTPKFEVEDSQGIRWRVKLGSEAQTEIAATRLLWAMGYFVDEDYYLPEIKVQGSTQTASRSGIPLWRCCPWRQVGAET